jgi:hypothetical protein
MDGRRLIEVGSGINSLSWEWLVFTKKLFYTVLQDSVEKVCSKSVPVSDVAIHRVRTSAMFLSGAGHGCVRDWQRWK